MRNHLRALAAAILILGACASSGDDVENPIDARPGGNVDAPPGGNVDAPGGNIDAPQAGPGIGTACTGEGQGTCPAGFACLNLVGGSGSWCSKPCTGQSDLSCPTGYTGTGFPSCLLSVTPAGGGPAVSYCTIICQDEPGAPTLCPGGAAQCNMTCPTPLMCNGMLTADGSGALLGKVCE
jgi:hypothetical protein